MRSHRRQPTRLPVPGILQARTLEWAAISFSNAWKRKGKVKSLSCVWLLETPWTAAHQAPPSMGFSRQEYWSGVPVPSPFLKLLIFIYLFIYLAVLGLSCNTGIFSLRPANSWLWHVGSSSLTRDRTLPPHPLHWEHRVLATGPARESLILFSREIQNKSNLPSTWQQSRYLNCPCLAWTTQGTLPFFV